MHGQEFTGRLPQALQARGWRLWGSDGGHAMRLDGPPSSPFSAACHLNPQGWHSYAEWLGRTLGKPSSTLVEAIEALELAESQGLFSPLWRDPTPLPSRSGWVHSVTDGRDRWYAVVGDPSMALIVDVLLSVDRTLTPTVRFVTSVDGEVLTHDEPYALGDFDHESLTIHETACEAMAAAEREACRRAAAMGVNHRLVLMNLDGTGRVLPETDPVDTILRTLV